MTQFRAEILFFNPHKAVAAIPQLNEAGFDVAVSDFVDADELEGATSYVWAAAIAPGRADDAELWRAVEAIVHSSEGEVYADGTAKEPWRVALEAAVAAERKAAGLEFSIYPARGSRE